MIHFLDEECDDFPLGSGFSERTNNRGRIKKKYATPIVHISLPLFSVQLTELFPTTTQCTLYTE